MFRDIPQAALLFLIRIQHTIPGHDPYSPGMSRKLLSPALGS